VARKPATLLELCVARRGLHRGALTAAWVIQWAATARELGKFPTTAEYAEWWAVSDRNAWRHRAAIHEALGDDYQAVVLHIAQELDARMSRRQAMKLKVATA
jgi:hypothetical protein